MHSYTLRAPALAGAEYTSGPIPEMSAQPPGTQVWWAPPGPAEGLGPWIYGIVSYGIDPTKAGFPGYSLPAGYIDWYKSAWREEPIANGSPGNTFVYNTLVDYLNANYPADGQGFCTVTPYPLPSHEWGYKGYWYTTPCIGREVVEGGLPLNSKHVAAYHELLGRLQASGHQNFAAVRDGNLPFIKFSISGRNHLNEYDVVRNGQEGDVYRNSAGIYWDGKSSKMQVKFIEYFDKDQGISSWWNVYAVGVRELLEEITDLVAKVGCSAAGAIAASQYGEQGAAIWTNLCGGSGGGGGTQPSGRGALPWIIGGGVLLAAGSIAVLLKTRKR